MTLSTVKSHWRIVASPMGSFLDPPGSPTHRYSVHGWTAWSGQDPKRRAAAKSDEPDHSISLIAALRSEDVDETTKSRIRELIVVSEAHDSEDWQAHVYGYFNHCYSPDGIDRNVSECIVDTEDERPAEHHLGFLFIKQWFPNAVPRADLIKTGGKYGTEPCVHCGERIQYEARYDGWTVFGHTSLSCPSRTDGGNHERAS